MARRNTAVATAALAVEPAAVTEAKKALGFDFLEPALPKKPRKNGKNGNGTTEIKEPVAKTSPVMSIYVPKPQRVVVEVAVRGLLPGLMMDRKDPADLKRGDDIKNGLRPPLSKKEIILYQSSDYRFEHCQYKAKNPRTKQVENYMPGTSFTASLRDGILLVPGMEMMRKKTDPAIVVEQECVFFTKFSKLHVDERVVHQKGKGGQIVSIVRTRAVIDEWEAMLRIAFDPGVFTLEQVANLVAFAGYNVGVGNFRPQKRGVYGRWEIVALRQ